MRSFKPTDAFSGGVLNLNRNLNLSALESKIKNKIMIKRGTR